METSTRTAITVSTTVKAPAAKVWQYWTEPNHIINWNAASPDWHAPRAENNLVPGGQFSCRMEAKDGSMGFDFAGVYDEVEQHSKIAYSLGDGRKVSIGFQENGQETEVTETFEAEDQNSLELQKNGWQAILDNFKRYVEAN